MALIIDPDSLNQATEVTINTTAKTITLNEAGNLSADGVTGQALYSFLKEEWRTDANLIKYPFPMISITNEQFEFINDWELGNDASRKLIRNAGWAEVETGGSVKREYAGIVSLGTVGVADQPYFQQVDGAATVNFTYQGQVNEAVQIFGDASNGNFDYRQYFKIFIREQGKTYGQSQISEIGVTTMTYIVYRFPLSNGTDLKITETDVNIAANAPYTSIDVTYFATPQSRTIGGTAYNFDIIIDGANATAEQIYEKVQYLLRQTSDIDSGAGTVSGNSADSLLAFVGDTLVTSTGVYIDNFNSNDTNRIEFFDNTGTKRTFPFVAAGTISFNINLQNDASALYWVFFSDDINTASALIVDDADGNDIAGSVAGNSEISFTFDYDGNTQGGRTAGTDANITLRALGLDTGQFVEATGTITRAIGQNFSLVSSLERNYSNPA